MATLPYIPEVKASYFDPNNAPLVGGLVYTYEAGTSTLLATYSDSAGTVLNDNPVVLDSRGQANIYLQFGRSYKIVVKNSLGVTQYERDNVVGNGGASGVFGSYFNVKDYGAIGDGVADDTAAIQATIDAASLAASFVYLPTGTYKITDTLVVEWTQALQGIIGDTVAASVIDGSTLTTNAIEIFESQRGFVMKQFTVIGPGQGSPVTSSGVMFKTVGYIPPGLPPTGAFGVGMWGAEISNICIKKFPTYGLYVQIPVFSSFDTIVVDEVGDIGYFLDFYVPYGEFIGGTSTNWRSCWANNILGTGFRFNAHVYFNMSACATDYCETGYYFYRCGAGTFSSGGCEFGTYVDASNPGRSIVMHESYNCNISGNYVFELPNVASLVLQVIESTACQFTNLTYNQGTAAQPTNHVSIDANSGENIFTNCMDNNTFTPFVFNDLGYDNTIIFGNDRGFLTLTTEDGDGNVLQAEGSIIITKPTYAAVALYTGVEADPRLTFDNNGVIVLGSGTGAGDLWLTRSGVSELTISNPAFTGGNLSVLGSVTVGDVLTTTDVDASGDVTVALTLSTQGQTTFNNIAFSNATAISASNITLTGWSTTTINYVSGNNAAGSVGLDVAGTPAANPVVRVTYQAPVPGAYSTIPSVVVCGYAAATNFGHWIVTAQTATYFEARYIGTPGAGDFVGFNYIVFSA